MVEELKAEKATIEKIKEDQIRFLQEIKVEKSQENHKYELTDKLKKMKEVCKILSDEKHELEKQVNLIHLLALQLSL